MQTLRTLGFVAATLWTIQGSASEPRVLASLTQPPGGLDCAHAVDRTEVVFDFQQPRSDIKQLSVFVNGKGVPEDAVSQDWPRLRVLHGLHVGRNTVEAVATGADNKSVSHKLTVLVGEAPDADEKGAAIVDCEGGNRDVARQDDSDEPSGEVLDEEGDAVEDVDEEVEDDVEYVDRTVYVDAPAYIYRPYPAFAFIAYEPAYYYPYYSGPYYSYRPYRHYGYYGGGSYSRNNVWRSHDRHDGWDGGHHGGSDDGHHRYRPDRPPTHGAWRGSSGPSQQRAQPQSRPAPSARTESHRTDGNRDRR